ncbi:YitT family protein [Microaceticoccus formicicus]|uniref:YitT family protein n=1 Tax=Microaceticoccus formicicus TaxID=3118105 RepID=UPI003CD030FA|nr:YitT family protein [Peptoniphilaceae bacterium AMB_02]
MFSFIKRIALITIAVFVIAIGIYYLWIPLKLAPGGTTGLTVIIKSLFPRLPVSLAIGIINFILLLLGFIFIGKEFGGYTIYSSVMLSFFIRVFEQVYPVSQPVVDNVFLNLIFGGLFVGFGIGIVFNQNASTGGTDIVAMILNKFYHISLSTAVLIADLVITLVATYIVGLEIGMYSILGIMINSLIIGKVISGFNTRIEMMIITSKFDQVNVYLNKEIGRGTTIYHAEGGFSYEPKKVISTVLSKNEYIKAKLYLKEIDPGAFVIINNVNEVVGEGFTYEKLI